MTTNISTLNHEEIPPAEDIFINTDNKNILIMKIEPQSKYIGY